MVFTEFRNETLLQLDNLESCQTTGVSLQKVFVPGEWMKSSLHELHKIKIYTKDWDIHFVCC